MSKKKIVQAAIFILLLIPLGLTVRARIRIGPDGAGRPEKEQEVPQAAVPEETLPPLVEPGTFVISAVGDCTLASAENFINSDYGYAAKMDGDYAYPFSNTAEYFKNDDFTITNLECVLSDKKSLTASYLSQFHYKGPTDYANILIEGGVDFVTTANNHLLEDYSERGAEETYTALDAHGVPYGKEGQAQIITTDSGLVLGIFCAYNNFDIDQNLAVASIRQLKAEGAEYIICMFHWGRELYYSPSQQIQDLAHACADAGANLIYGSHSHCLQPIEQYYGSVILYSMGNWTFGGNTMPTDPDTAIVQITVDRASDGTVTNSDINIIPCCVSSQPYVAKTHYNDYRPTPYEEGSEGYERVLQKLDGSFQPETQGANYSDWWEQQLQK